MAGIGFEMRRLVRKGTVCGFSEAYAFAGIVGSGPWVLSIVAVLAIGLVDANKGSPMSSVAQFQVAVTYLMATSLILTSLVQLTFTRFVADRIFEGNDHLIVSNLFGALFVTMLGAGLTGAVALMFTFNGSFVYRQCMLAGFVTLSGIWVVVTFASAIKAHRRILLAFFVGYGVTVAGALGLRRLGLDGLLVGFVAGQAFLFFALLALVVRQYPGSGVVSFEFLRKDRLYLSLVVTGVFYNIGVWADKFIFWADPLTGVSVEGSLRASPIYDLPIFLGYLSLIPGMAVFLMRVEIDFAEVCAKFYTTIRNGGTLAEITEAKNSLTESVRGCLLSVLKVQGATTLILFIVGADLLNWFGISLMYRPLLSINLVSAAVQLLLLAILNMLFYLDQRQVVMRLCVFFACSNIVLSLLSLRLGPAYFGYGFAVSVLLTAGVGLAVLSRSLDRLEFETFMLQPVLS